jgi:hypothetical protein
VRREDNLGSLVSLGSYPSLGPVRVSKESATFVGYDAISINVNHVDMVKFEST